MFNTTYKYPDVINNVKLGVKHEKKYFKKFKIDAMCSNSNNTHCN